MIVGRNLNSSIVESATTIRPYSVHSHGFAVKFLGTINFYYTPFLIIFGCFGNLLSLYVFFTKEVRLQSTSVYLSALAVSDTLFLLQLFPPWLDAVQFSMHFCRPAVCYTVTYVSYVTSALSTWIVVAFTVERFVAVLYPLQRSLICTVHRAKYLVAFLATTIVLLNLPVFKFLSPPDNCSVDTAYMDYATRFNMIDTAISFTAPLGAIIVLNVRIMKSVWRYERARALLLRVGQQPGPSRVRDMRPPGASPQHRVTRMLLIVSSVFVVLNLPAYTMRLMAYTKVNQPQGGVWRAFQQLASIFFDTNFGINFMLYCLTGQKFRRALCKAVPFLRRYVRSANVIRAPCPPIRSISTSYASAGPEMIRMVALPAGPSERQVQVRRHRSEPVIRRWTFDNSRKRLQNEEIELSTFENRRRRPRNEELEMPNFDNIRQLIPHEEFEMRNYDNRHLRAQNEEMEMAILSVGRDITPDLIRDTQGLSQPGPVRSIPFLLFPYRHLGGSGQAQGSMVTYN